MQKDSIDLMNIDYDDVLHLYRGWRRSESALKDKNKELAALKESVKQLQESHSKFRGQIGALESVKELTINLQNQLAVMEQENKQLVAENRELAELNAQAEHVLKEKTIAERKQAQVLKDVQLEVANIQGRYEESVKAQNQLEVMASEEKAVRMAMETRLSSSHSDVDHVKEENRVLRDKLASAEHRMSQCDHEMSHAAEQLHSLSHEVADVTTTKTKLTAAETELGIVKGDIARLLRLMEHSPATRGFLHQWQASNGMDFVGIARDHHDHDRSSSGLDHSTTSVIGGGSGRLFDSSMMTGTGIGTEDESALQNLELTPTEFAHLKRVHGGDPFPMSKNMEEEGEYWVPSAAARLGLDFLSSKIPHASPRVIMDFLRSMNKIWLRRERRRVKKIRTLYNREIEDLKRQLSNARPYQGVLAERQIRRLKSQVHNDRVKHLTGRPRKYLEEGLNQFEDIDQMDDTAFLSTDEKRLCKIMNARKEHSAADVTAVSTEKLLEASLNSLESMSKHVNLSMSNSLLDTSINNHSRNNSSLGGHANAAGAGGPADYPNDSYLRGALWLGRNLTMVSEELSEELEAHRVRILSEVANAAQDTDSRRCAHRMSLLASTAAAEATSMTNKSKMRAREILQGAASLTPGDSTRFNAFLQTLPIESALASPNMDHNLQTLADLQRQREAHRYHSVHHLEQTEPFIAGSTSTLPRHSSSSPHKGGAPRSNSPSAFSPAIRGTSAHSMSLNSSINNAQHQLQQAERARSASPSSRVRNSQFVRSPMFASFLSQATHGNPHD